MTDSSKASFSYTVSAPGKIILFGEHSVVYKKTAVSTTIDRRLYVVVTSLSESQVCLNLPLIGTEIVWDLEQFEKVVKEKCPLKNSEEVFTLDNPDTIDHEKYLESLKINLESLGVGTNELQDKSRTALLGFLYIMRGICHTLNCDLVPFALKIKSELEVGSGTGSSAAYAVAIAGSVLNFRKCLEPISIALKGNSVSTSSNNVIINSYSQKSGFSLEEMKIINKWSFCVEKIMHGRPSGIDNTTCTFGSVVVTTQEINRPGELMFRFLENVPTLSILLISTGVSRNTANLVMKVKQLRDKNCAAIDAILNAMDVIAQEAFTTLNVMGINSSNASKNMELYSVLCGLIELNHGLLRTLGVSHESLERIITVSNNHGLKSKLTGAGGGGYAITLLLPDTSKSKIEQMKKELGPAFNVLEINIAEEGVRLEKHVK